jgi:hypothetical protein
MCVEREINSKGKISGPVSIGIVGAVSLGKEFEYFIVQKSIRTVFSVSTS